MNEHTTHYDDCGCFSARYEARIATLEAELAEEVELRERLANICKRTALALKGPEKPLASHSWADLPDYAVLQVEVEARLIADLNRVLSHANALRDALQDCFEWFDARADVDHVGDPMRPFPNAEAIQREHVLAALAQTPAATLAAHDAEVLERAATCAESYLWNLPAIQSQVGANCGDAIRALAAQAQEVK